MEGDPLSQTAAGVIPRAFQCNMSSTPCLLVCVGLC